MTYTRGTARMRGLAAELKEMRADAGLSTRQAAKRAGLSASTLHRIELGNRGVQVVDLVALMVVYGVKGVDRDRMLMTAREASHPVWCKTSGFPGHLPALSSFESEATRISHLAVLRMPGLMQTPAYIHAFMTACGITGRDADARVVARLRRQAVLDRSVPPRYLTIIDESVLRRQVGGPHVMAEQLRHVADRAARPNIEVRVIPLEHGAHPGLDGTITLLEFARARAAVFLENKRASLFLDEPDDVSPFQKTIGTLLDVSLDSPESVKLMTRIAAEFDQR